MRTKLSIILKQRDDPIVLKPDAKCSREDAEWLRVADWHFICETDDELMERIRQIIALGHDFEVVYLED